MTSPWFKVLAMVGIVVLFVGRMFAGHGPGAHPGSADAVDDTRASQNISLNQSLTHDGYEK